MTEYNFIRKHPLQEGDTRTNSSTGILERYTPEGKWEPVKKKYYQAIKQTVTKPVKKEPIYPKKTLQEGDVRYNPKTEQNEKYSPEGKWVPISPKIVIPPTENKTDKTKEWGLGNPFKRGYKITKKTGVIRYKPE